MSIHIFSQLIVVTTALSLAGAGADVMERCSGWSLYNESSESCICGSSLLGIVDCRSAGNDSVSVYLTICHCMSRLDTQESSLFVVGDCVLSCTGFFKDMKHPQFRYLRFTEAGDDKICTAYNRKGPMCGNCHENYAPAAYSYNFTCTECTDYKYNWVKYVAIAYLPLTVFYIAVLGLKISATSGSMNAFVMICQLGAAQGIVRFYFIPNHAGASKLIKIVTAASTIFNLDFFRSFYRPFCLHPSMTTIQVFALDYAIGLYPLFLIAVTYSFVKLHDRYSLIL